MKFRERAVNIFKCFRNNKKNSLRDTAKQTSIPKSSVHRHKSNQAKRIDSVGHSFFETEEGIAWLKRLFFAVILVFGIQAGVGSETISLFFNVILLTTYIATSPSCIRNVKQTMRNKIDDYGEEQMDEVLKRCGDKELHLGGDETFFGNTLFLVLMELKSGFIFKEELTEDRKYTTWDKCVGELLKGFKKVLSFTSDGGLALLKLGKKVGCDNVMDLFHLLQDIKRLFATKFHSKRRALQSKLAVLKKTPLSSNDEQDKAIAAIHAGLAQLDKGQKSYWNTLFIVSTQSHPFKQACEAQSSQEMETTLHQQETILRETAKACQIKDKNNLLNRFKKRIKPLSQLNDLWHAWVGQSISCKTHDSEIKAWAQCTLLPYIYWKEQVRKPKRSDTLKKHYQQLEKKAKTKLDAHELTLKHLSDDWLSWAESMAIKYQRTTSAIEGRNARLAQHYFNSRGIRKSHVNPLTVLHNFWIKRNDNTTAAERLCDFRPPDLFEYLLKNMGDIPLPRSRNENLLVAA